MAKSKRGRKLMWLAAGAALFAIPLASPETFDTSKLFKGSHDPVQSGAAVFAPGQEPSVALDPVDEAVSGNFRDRHEARRISGLYGIDPKPEGKSQAESGVSSDKASTTPDDLIQPNNKRPSNVPSDVSNPDPDGVAVTSDNSDPTPTNPTQESARDPDANTSKGTMVDAQAAPGETLSNDAGPAEELILTDDPATPKLWVREVASGDSLDVLLKEAGIFANQRYAITSAIGEKFDLSRLRPGNILTVVKDLDGNVTDVELQIDKNNSVLVSVGDDIKVTIVKPDASRFTLANEITITGSIFSSLNKEGVPEQFATKLASALSGHINFRRDLQAGDILELLWSEKRTEDGDVIGDSDLTYARLNARGQTYDVVWESGGSPLVFRDHKVIRTFSPPVPGSRISSSYGMRRHPVYGGRRMHEGTDFAAAAGTPVLASTAGVVSYVGRRGAYGRVVEIKHSPSVTTRYAHLSRYSTKRGQRVEAGDRVGYVGSSGRVTGAHLHYEFLLNGRAVNPMSTGRWDSLEASSDEQDILGKLHTIRKTYEQRRSEVQVKEVSQAAPLIVARSNSSAQLFDI